ncbi:putative anti-sigma regulatory factor, serine/threonine protein kinase [Dethiosulfovibrio peptidovorans DSM 11002]|uniref:Anti-sigma regulatory factor, serine/threonine protein kinase n=1 Tax=Dethiosulfovibrio peptidovorans DSM 11002 TaxID=469381 RepID=D2Z8M0_9BACT|nr:GNAT family N-acetyltransferase [Dethiosulfovibrio peptidovorans]EFC91817.1 putative anti-sigma regulatory factor, serine/threonine protein kinase [Dethiosulfovibrio peptidovorans DSM 11002]
MAGESLRSSVSLPTDLTYLEPLEGFVRGLCRVAGCDQRDTSMVALAIEEAVSNVIQHGYDQGETDVFDVSFDVGAAGIVVEVHDKGLPFDPESFFFKEPLSGGAAPERGIGIKLMKGAMDRVEFVNLGKGGKLVRMTKYFRHRRIDSYFTDGELVDSPEEESFLGPFEVRVMKSEEALEISRCAYRAYGYSYREFVYYPERIRELNESGMMRSFVAIDSRNSLVGHLALSFSDLDSVIAEMAAAFVNPSCRGQGILGMMNEMVMAEAERSGLQGLFVHAVTSHVASQRGAAKSGFMSTGILLGALFSDLNFKALAGEVRQRESAAIMYRPLCHRVDYDIWVPDRYVSIVSAIVASCGVNGKVRSSPVSLPERASRRGEGNRAYKVGEFNFGEIRIVDFGQDSLTDLHQRLREFRRDRLDVVYLYLDAEVPEAVPFAEECRRMGFVFSGYLPGELRGHDALILQYLDETSLDPSRINLAGKMGQDILEYIVAEMDEREESL